MSYSITTADFTEIVFRDHKLHPTILVLPNSEIRATVPPWEVARATALAERIVGYRGGKVTIAPQERRVHT